MISLKVASSPADVAEKADRIITMLPTSMNSIEVYSGANGILKYVFLKDCSSCFTCFRTTKALQLCWLKNLPVYFLLYKVNRVISCSP